MRLIVDASIAVKWVIQEDDTELALSLSRFTLAAPEILLGECANALWKAVRRGDLTPAIAQNKLNVLSAATIDMLPIAPLVGRALEIGCTLGHPVYDCLYLAAAEREGCPAVTADTRLLRVLASQPAFNHLAISLQDAAAD